MSCFLFLGAVLWPLVIATLTQGENGDTQRTAVLKSFEAIGERVPVQEVAVVEVKEPVESEHTEEESEEADPEEQPKDDSVPVEAEKKEKTTSVENNRDDALASVNTSTGGTR